MTLALQMPAPTAAHDGAPAIVATIDPAQAAARIAIWRASDAAFDAWLKEGAAEAVALRRMALARWSLGNPRLASVMLATAAAIDGAKAECWLDLGFTLQASGETRQALLALQKGLELNPSAARGWLALGLVANQLGDGECAEQAFETALQGDPSLADAAFGLGLVAFDRRHYAKSAAGFRRALELGVTLPLARLGLGQSLFFLGNFVEAARELRLAVAAGAEASLLNRAALASYIAGALKGDYDEADRAYHEIVGARAEAADAVAFSAFRILGAYGHRAEALALAEARMTARAQDPEQRYLVSALAGEAPERAPADYLVAHFDESAELFDHQMVQVLGYDAPRQLLELMGQNATGLKRVLDLGCGTGLAGPLLRPGRDCLVGVDLSQRMLAKARGRQVYHELVNGDLVEFLQSTAERFDLLFAADTLIYFGNLKPVFAGAARVMAAGALFAFNIETTNSGAYEVTFSGRFAHDLSHVAEVGAPWFRVRRFRRAELRREGVDSARGALVVMERRGFVSRQSAFVASPTTRAA